MHYGSSFGRRHASRLTFHSHTMAKKKKLQPQAPLPMTRGQMIRAQQEQKKIRNLYTSALAVGLVIVLVLAFAAVSTFIIRPNTEVARVNGTVINRGTYEKLRRYGLYQDIQNQAIQQQLSQSTGSTASALDPVQAGITQLQNVSSEQTLDEATVSQLVDAEVLRQASTKQFGINPTQGDLKTFVLKDFEPQPTPPVTPSPTGGTATAAVVVTTTGTTTPTAPPSPTATATKGSPTKSPTTTATLPPVPGAAKTAEAVYTNYVSALSNGVKPSTTSQFCRYGCPNISEQDYLGLIVEPRYRHDKVLEKLVAQSIVTDVEQINVQQILTDTQAGALKLKQMLDNGADFAQLANTQSKEQLDNIKNGQQPNGGELGWTSKDDTKFVKPFIDAAWKVPTGKYSDPVQTQFGWHIIKVSERDPKRPLADDVLTQKKTKLYDDWLAKARDAADVQPKPTPTPPPPTPLVSEPTVQSSGSPGASTPGASPPITGTTGVTGTQQLPVASPTTAAQTATSTQSQGIGTAASPSPIFTATIPATVRATTPAGTATP